MKNILRSRPRTVANRPTSVGWGNKKCFFPANSGRSGANRRKEPHDDRSPSYAVRDGDRAAGQVTSSHVKKLEVTAMKMCRWACGHTLRVHVRNDNNRDRLNVELSRRGAGKQG